LTLDLAFFEHPDFYDRLQNARRESGYKPVDLINDTFLIVQNTITLIRLLSFYCASVLARHIPLSHKHSRFHC